MLGKKAFRLLLVGALVLALMVPTFAFTDYQKYTAYALRSFQRANYTNTHDKETDDDYIRNHVITFTDTTEADFWAADADNTKISRSYPQKEGNKTTINFYDDVNLDEGDQVKMGMRNHYRRTYHAFVTGKVNFE